MKALTNYIKEIQEDKGKKAHFLGTIYIITLFIFALIWLFGVFMNSESCDKIVGVMAIVNIMIIVITLIYYALKGDKFCCKAYLKGCFGGYMSILKCIFMTALGG